MVATVSSTSRRNCSACWTSIYLTEVWIEAQPRTDHVWLVLKRDAKDRQGCPTCGTALDADAVGMMFRHYSAKSGVRLHPHMLRHTHATELVRSYLTVGQAVDWKFIQERLGHASVVTTMQIYAHVSDEDRRRAYRTLPWVRICELAGYSRGVWGHALGDERFVAQLAALGVPVQRPSKVDSAKRALLDRLGDEANRSLAMAELRQRAGLAGAGLWHGALRDESFTAQLQALGLKLGRFCTPHLDVALAPDPELELQHDVWAIRRLKADYPKHVAPAQFLPESPGVHPAVPGPPPARRPRRHPDSLAGGSHPAAPG